MFKKKIKETEKTEETVIDISEAPVQNTKEDVINQKKSSRIFSLKKEEQKELVKQEEPTQVVEEVQNDLFIWANSPDYEEKQAKENKKRKHHKKSEEEVLDIPKEYPPYEEKKELSTYFEADKGKSKKLKRKAKKSKVSVEKEKNSKRQSRKEKLQEDIKNQKLFKYNNKKYTKVEDFITYLNEHYLDIEEISEEVLDNENFFGWINKNSGMFNQSLQEYKEIKAKIENKS